MATRNDVLREMVDELYPMAEGQTLSPTSIDFHLLSVICLLCVRSDVLAKTLPIKGGVCADALRDLGVDPVRVPVSVLEKLIPYREAFAAVQRAWLQFAGYRNPPCPPNPIAKELVALTKQLGLTPAVATPPGERQA